MTDTEPDPRFEALLDYLKRSRGFDFTGYKRPSLTRRVHKRMQILEIETFSDYVDYLEVHPDEFTLLFNTIFINVTGFFRDPASWEFLRQQVIPAILAQKMADEHVRVWSAGCASGEEAYSLAICLAEALGMEHFRDRVKIYATDIDDDALTQARHASYIAKDLEEVPEDLRDKYFSFAGGKYVFRADLRRSVIFGRHDLVQDPPISRIDLLVCRNTLMYMNAELQTRILARLHFALSDTGYMFLGKAEMLLTHSDLFRQLDMKHRIFVKASRATLRDRLLSMALAGDNEAMNSLNKFQRLREASFENADSAQLVVDAVGTLVLANAAARDMFGLSAQDLGRPLQDLEISYRPLDLRSLIDRAYVDHAPVRIQRIDRAGSNGGVQSLDVCVVPLYSNGKEALGVAVSYSDVTSFVKLQHDLERSNQELETANEELQSAHEELETTNEELQSTNEELETTNEELQSTNEELETMNEELQSTNEELETINTELRELTHDANRTTSFLESILSSMRSAVVVVDLNFHVVVWNHRAEDLWGLKAKEVEGKSIFELDVGLPVQDLKDPLQAFIGANGNGAELELQARNRRGRKILCEIALTPLLSGGKERKGVVITIDERDSDNG